MGIDQEYMDQRRNFLKTLGILFGVGGASLIGGGLVAKLFGSSDPQSYEDTNQAKGMLGRAQDRQPLQTAMSGIPHDSTEVRSTEMIERYISTPYGRIYYAEFPIHRTDLNIFTGISLSDIKNSSPSIDYALAVNSFNKEDPNLTPFGPVIKHAQVLDYREEATGDSVRSVAEYRTGKIKIINQEPHQMLGNGVINSAAGANELILNNTIPSYVPAGEEAAQRQFIYTRKDVLGIGVTQGNLTHLELADMVKMHINPTDAIECVGTPDQGIYNRKTGEIIYSTYDRKASVILGIKYSKI